jgi:hypothetical protein
MRTITLAALVLGHGWLAAQAQPAKPSFEVASIKRMDHAFASVLLHT